MNVLSQRRLGSTLAGSAFILFESLFDAEIPVDCVEAFWSSVVDSLESCDNVEQLVASIEELFRVDGM